MYDVRPALSSVLVVNGWRISTVYSILRSIYTVTIYVSPCDVRCFCCRSYSSPIKPRSSTYIDHRSSIIPINRHHQPPSIIGKPLACLPFSWVTNQQHQYNITCNGCFMQSFLLRKLVATTTVHLSIIISTSLNKAFCPPVCPGVGESYAAGIAVRRSSSR